MDLILEVFVIFATAKAAGELCVRLGLPAIVGELLVGVGLGPHALDWVKVDQATAVLSQLGIVILLFVAGLETRLSDLLSVGRTSALTSVGGMVAAGGAGFGIVAGFGYPARAAAVAGVALAASSVGIAARAFSDLATVGSRPAPAVFGAAVIEDVVVLAAALVGAFLAGMALAETREQYDLGRRMEPLFDFLVPFFFVVSGARTDPGALGNAGPGFVGVLVAATVAAKLVGCAAGATGLPIRE